ncbi:MAG: hypothetical protein V4447_14465 [Pseudomonadota bacterium]
MKIQCAKHRQGGAINLAFVALLMMALSLAAFSLLYYMRYGHVPLQDVWQRWSKSADAVLSGRAVTVDEGILRCTVKGKVVFSDVDCSESNPTTRTVKLVDNKGGEPPKASAAGQAHGSVQASVQASNEVDVKSQMIDKAVK